MMSDKNYSYEQLNSTINRLNFLEQELSCSEKPNEFVLKTKRLLSYLQKEQIISEILSPILQKKYEITLESWLNKNKNKNGLTGFNSVELPDSDEEKVFIAYNYLDRVKDEGIGILFSYFVRWTKNNKTRVLAPSCVSLLVTPMLDFIRDELEKTKNTSESILKSSQNYYSNSIHNEVKGNHAPVTVTTIQINSDKKDEIINTLKQALSKVDEIENEDQRELASEYLEQTLDEVESGNIKPEKIEKRKKFFEKHKVDWVGIAGLALAGFQIIKAFTG